MSRKLVTLVYERKVGSGIRKAVLAYMADRANDNGSGVWVSKVRIARETEFSRTAVIRNIKEMVSEGLLTDNGIINGRSTNDYTINVRALTSLPPAQEDDEGCTDVNTPPVQIRTGGVLQEDRGCPSGGHEPSFNRPLTTADAGLIDEMKKACGESDLLNSELAKLTASIISIEGNTVYVSSKWAADRFPESLRRILKATGASIERSAK